MKKVLTILSLVLMMALTAYSQGWTHLGNFPDDNYVGGSGGHGVAVDPDGKIWVQIFGNTDSIFNGTNWQPCRVISVFNPDGSPAAFSPIKTVTVGGVTDTLFNSNRGLRADKDGNIIVASFDVYYKLDYTNGNGIYKGQPVAGMTLTAAAVDDNNNIFSGPVIPGNPINIYTEDFTFLGTAVDTSIGFSRAFEVSGDGNTIYWAGYTNHHIKVYNRPSEFDPFTYQGNVLQGFDSESFCWSPITKLLWASSGSYNDLPNRDTTVATYWDVATWYAWDPATNTIVDSIKWQFNVPASPNERPRGIAFSPDEKYAYVTTFGASDVPVVQKFENPNPPSSVDDEGQVVVNGYKLSQNYPNPFNPSTKISFELASNGFVSLKVYDMLGREVANLVDKEMTSGSHTVNFNASNLASGTYIYRLTANGNVLTNKMTLLK